MLGVFYDDNKFNTKLVQAYTFMLYLRRIIYVGLGMLINNPSYSSYQIISILYLNLIFSIYNAFARS